MIKVKRVYDEPSDDDGVRILVERLWPRGLSKDRACVDLWLKDIAPSAELRVWFSHDPAKWNGFRERYGAELERKPEFIRLLREKSMRGTVTLVYAAHDVEHNSAVALLRFMKERAGYVKARPTA